MTRPQEFPFRMGLAFPSSKGFSRFACERSMPSNFGFQAWNVAPHIPCLRQTSAVFAPVSRRIAMICSLVNSDLLMAGPFHGPDSGFKWTCHRGSEKLRERSLRSLYCCSDSVRGRGAPVTNLSHDASFRFFERIAPTNRGIRHPGATIATKRSG
jgi:hypothetical protein